LQAKMVLLGDASPVRHTYAAIATKGSEQRCEGARGWQT
jgi:hypothetical protein